MAQMSEAACLLQSGSMYSRRVGFLTPNGSDLFVGVKPGAVSIYLDDDPIYHFDLDGRWQRAFVNGVHYLKGLDATVRSIDRDRESNAMVLHRQTLGYAQSTDLDASIRSMALNLIADLDVNWLEVVPGPMDVAGFAIDDLRSFLERVIAWDSASWFAHRERYLATYGPLPFLPPDCPNALILQSTLGHDQGRVFGRSRPAEHYVRSSSEFREHLRAVEQLVGRRVAQSRRVFLGGADVLRQPLDQILETLEAVGSVFPVGAARPIVPPTEGSWDDPLPQLGLIHAFLDDFRSPLPDPGGWSRLKLANLGRVTLGLSSGDPEVLKRLGQAWEPDDLIDLVANLKVSGLGVGFVVLAGAGGRAHADRHLAATIALLKSLPIGPGDLVTLVDARDLDESPVDWLEPLSDAETALQLAAIKQSLVADAPSKGPKVVTYNPAKQGV